MLNADQIAAAGLTDWRKLGQGFHARFLTEQFGDGARFATAIAAAGDELGHQPRIMVGDGFVDLKTISRDATYRAGGTTRVVEWVTQQDVELARRISEIAADQGLRPDPASISTIEIALDTADSARIAPMWAALLTGSTDSRGRGNLGDHVRDATERVPGLWFQDTEEHETPRQRFHLDVWVAP